MYSLLLRVFPRMRNVPEETGTSRHRPGKPIPKPKAGNGIPVAMCTGEFTFDPHFSTRSRRVLVHARSETCDPFQASIVNAGPAGIALEPAQPKQRAVR